ncbi:hypothetical protein PIB30_087501 [Stylosanthes scabra]|uniref:Uncharacterized protein n=1 Tax=Stylosanthes scabra TaxID=79078 RepID=A0ABU6YS98_9FABA|nr:hypothetical protein [Stylosanthes scabra]
MDIHHMMASKGKSVARQPSTRTRGASSRRQPSQEDGNGDTFWEHIARRRWDFMYDPTIDINITLVRELYANRNEKNQKEAYMRGRRIPCHFRDIEGVLHLLRLEGKSGHHQAGERYDKNDLDMNESLVGKGRHCRLYQEDWIRIYC